MTSEDGLPNYPSGVEYELTVRVTVTNYFRVSARPDDDGAIAKAVDDYLANEFFAETLDDVDYDVVDIEEVKE